jgi:hypothetical protein
VSSTIHGSAEEAFSKTARTRNGVGAATEELGV